MATKSIIKSIVIKEKHAARSFADALEKAAKKTTEPVNVTKTVKVISKNKIKELFADYDHRN